VGSKLKTEYSGLHKDEYYTPYSGGDLGPAIDVQATQFLNLIHGDWLTRLPPKLEFMVIIFSGILFGFGLAFFRPLVASGLAILAAVVVIVLAHFLFWEYRLWFSWMLIVAVQIPIALLWSVIFNSVQLYVQNKLFEQSLEMYLSPKLVKKFAANRDLLKPGAKNETLTILFTDIASFTSISEGMEPDDLAHHMNLYFETAVAQCIHHTDGTIVKYIGDAIFSFWNAPDLQHDHQLRACEAALAFRNLPPQFMNNQQLITRIGLHTGVASVGNFGSTARVDYTALGENINLAARMEGLNKYLGTIVLLTEETHAGIENKFTTRFLGNFRLKGFEKSIGVYELLGAVEKAAEVRPLTEGFAIALKLFKEKKFTVSGNAFRKVLEIEPKDGPSKFYLKQITELQDQVFLHNQTLPEDWNGEVELKEK
jgi:adenylate cyclase